MRIRGDVELRGLDGLRRRNQRKLSDTVEVFGPAAAEYSLGIEADDLGRDTGGEPVGIEQRDRAYA